MPKKNNHTHKTIFTWIGNLPTITELQGFHYYQGKYKVQLQCFTLSQDDNNNKTLITKNGFYIIHTGFTMGYKTGQKFFPGALPQTPKRLVYEHSGLGLSTHASAPWTKLQKIFH